MWASALFLVGLTAAATVAWATRSVSGPPETTRTLLSVAPGDQSLAASPLEQRVGNPRPTRTAVALSPDGKTLVFAAIWGGGQQLYIRAMDQLSATPLSGTSGGSSPFFSPDGQWVGFGAAGELRKVPLSGGPAVTLCKAAALFGASWGSDGTIVFATARNGGLWRVPAAGGSPQALTTLQPGEYSHRLPHMLPGSHAVIFTVSKGAESLGRHADRSPVFCSMCKAGGSTAQTTTLMAVKVRTAPAFLAAAPERLFESVDLRYAWGRSYDVAPDGRFLIPLSAERPTNLAPAQMIFVQHWFEELKRLVPTN